MTVIRNPHRSCARVLVLALVLAGAVLGPSHRAVGLSGDGLGYGVTAVAGTSLRPLTDGPAIGTVARPQAVADDGAGGFYFADGSARVAHVAPDGRLRVVAGTGTYDDPVPGPALASPLTDVPAVVSDGRGTVYLAVGTQVLAVGPGGRLRVVAGDGTQGAPRPGLATSSPLQAVESLALTSEGTLLLGDVGNRQLLAVDRSGRLEVVAGTGGAGEVRPGEAARSPLVPRGIAVAPDGSLVVSHYVDVERQVGDGWFQETRHQVVVKIDSTGRLSVVAGTGEPGDPSSGPAVRSQFQRPTGVAVDAGGVTYVADPGSGFVVRISAEGHASLHAGNGMAAVAGQEGAALAVPMSPHTLAVDHAGELLVASPWAGAVLRVDDSAGVEVVAGYRHVPPHAGPALSSSLVVGALAHDPARGLLVHDQASNTVQLVDEHGELVHVLGNGRSGRPVPGPALETPLHGLGAMTVAVDGSIYFVDKPEFAVFRVTPQGVVEHVADTPGSPSGIAVDAAGNVYYADCGNGRLERIIPDGSREVLIDRSSRLPAGLLQARFNPFSTTSRPDGTVFTYDGGNGAVLRVRPGGEITSVAGTGSGTALGGRLGITELAVQPDGSVLLATGGDLWKLGREGGVVQLVEGMDRPLVRRGHSYLTIESLAVGAAGEVYVGSRLSSTVNLVDLDAAAPESLAQLRAERLTVKATRRPTATLRVRNLGDRSQPGLVVGLALDGRLVRTRTLTIGPGVATDVRFRVRRSWVSGHRSLRGVVDPFDSIAESDESDNSVGARSPRLREASRSSTIVENWNTF